MLFAFSPVSFLLPPILLSSPHACCAALPAGKPLPPQAYTYNQRASKLTLHSVPSSSFELRIKTAIHPEANTGLQGLFVRAGIYATAVRRVSWWHMAAGACLCAVHVEH
jgi:hypothetical protein